MEHELDDLIADYIQGTLPADAQTAFEKRMSNEPALASRVALESGLFHALGNAGEQKLRSSLQAIADKIDIPVDPDAPSMNHKVNSSKGKWWIWGGLILCAGLMGGYIWYQSRPSVTVQPSQKSDYTPALPDKPAADLSKPTDTIPQKTRENRLLMAAAFKPIPNLESYIGSQVRSGGLHLKVEEPRSGATLSYQGKNLPFRLSGKVEGASLTDITLRAMVFSNDQRRFEQMQPLDSTLISFDQKGGFRWEKNQHFPPGLYYILITDEASGAWVYVDKILVK